MTGWRCKRCGGTNNATWRRCEGCSRPRPVSAAPVRVDSTAPVLALLQPRLPLTPEEQAQVDTERARLKALLAPAPVRSGRGLPPIAPEVRAEVARRAELSDRVAPPDLAEMDAEAEPR